MLFALADYRNYKRRKGRFARDFEKSIMGGAFEGSLPDTVFRVLRPGDVMFVQTLDWPLAWAIMYLTQSEVSHCAFYVGDRQIAHATLAGVTFDDVDTLFTPSTRILPCVWPMPDEKRSQVVQTIRDRFEGVPYGWYPALLKGARILVGRDWPYFRWTFFVDVALVIFLLESLLYPITGHPILSWVVLAYFLTIVLNSALWRIKPLRFSEWTGKPCDMVRMLQVQGGQFLFDAYELQQQLRREPDSKSHEPDKEHT